MVVTSMSLADSMEYSSSKVSTRSTLALVRLIQCPFGAVMDKSYVVDVIQMLLGAEKWGLHVYAILAPSCSQGRIFLVIAP